MRLLILVLLPSLLGCFPSNGQGIDRGYITTYGSKYMWTGTEDTFVPNYIMIDVIANQREKGSSNDLSAITEGQMDAFIQTFLVEHGFNGVHIPVYGQWFHIGDNVVKAQDKEIDQKTFDQLKMIISKVYEAGGCAHLWLWGDAQRGQTSKSLESGIMGKEERLLLDEIYQQLNPVKGWTLGYGFDLWEWVTEQELEAWHNYLWQKRDWKHLLGARASKNQLNQLYEGLDISCYEYHKPSYQELLEMLNVRPGKPSFSSDRYRIRTPSKYPEKDYSADETLKGLWYHTMAGGVAAIWGNLDGSGEYDNKEALKCFSVFWNDKNRFTPEMKADTTFTDAYCLTDRSRYAFYKENTDQINYQLSGDRKDVIAVDTRKAYQELKLGTKDPGRHLFKAPYPSDWVIWAQ